MSYDWATNKKVIILGAFSGGTATTRPVPHPRGSDQLALPYTVEGKGLRNPHAKFDTFFINVTIVTCFCTAKSMKGLFYLKLLGVVGMLVGQHTVKKII